MERLDVALEGARGYPIFVGRDLFSVPELSEIVGSQVAVVTNRTVADLHLEKLAGFLPANADVIEIGDGESYKTLQTYAEVIDRLIAGRHNRATTVIALGGGVVGDLAGFVAATYQRGVQYVQVPTTLLAQVDSSVGGKTGVNHPAGKNMIGAFYQPRLVLADIGLLDTLPDRQFRAGLAEVIKYGVIFDAGFFGWLEENQNALLVREPAALAHAIRRSCEIKAEVVGQDERESGLRMILNYGHTFGHAIESLTAYEAYLHGEAVAIGMIMAADLSHRLGRISLDDAKRIRGVIEAYGLPVQPPPIADDAMVRSMAMDKKALDGRLRFVVVDSIGRVSVADDIAVSDLAPTLAAGEGLCGG